MNKGTHLNTLKKDKLTNCAKLFCSTILTMSWKCSVSAVFLTLILAILELGVSVPLTADKIFFPTTNYVSKLGKRLGISGPKAGKKDVMKCLDLGDFMPAFNFTSEQFECYALASQGPCAGKHFVKI